MLANGRGSWALIPTRGALYVQGQEAPAPTLAMFPPLLSLARSFAFGGKGGGFEVKGFRL